MYKSKRKIKVWNSQMLINIAKGSEESFAYVCRQEKRHKAVVILFIKLMMKIKKNRELILFFFHPLLRKKVFKWENIKYKPT